MRQSHTETGDRRRRRAATAVITAVVAIGALTGATTAQAAPGDNWRHAMQCLNGGWHTLKRMDGRPFRNVGDCVVYALRGGQFQPAPPAPPPGGGE